MRRLGILFLTILIILGAVACGKESSTDNNNNKTPEFSFEVPKEWEGNYDIFQRENLATYFYKGYESNGYYQDFFTIEVIPVNEYDMESEDDPYLGTKLGEKDGYVFVLFTPLDCMITDEGKIEEYQSLFLPVSEIQKRFKIE